jgi:hypothetical protein
LLFNTNYTAGGRLDSPHYPTYRVPFVVGLKDVSETFTTKVLEYTVPFRGELFAISFDCSSYQNDDNWTLKVNGETICERIFVKRAPEGINLMAFIEVIPGDKITVEFQNTGAAKVIWASLHFLKEGDLTPNPPSVTPPPNGLSPIKVNVPVIRLYIYDWGNIDGDILNVYLNGALIKKEMYLYADVAGEGENGVNYLEIPLQLGDNEIVFEGVSPGNWSNNGSNNLTARFRVKDVNGNVIYDSSQLPDLTMEEGTNLDSNRRYLDPKPRVSWVVNRTI